MLTLVRPAETERLREKVKRLEAKLDAFESCDDAVALRTLLDEAVFRLHRARMHEPCAQRRRCLSEAVLRIEEGRELYRPVFGGRG